MEPGQVGGLRIETLLPRLKELLTRPGCLGWLIALLIFTGVIAYVTIIANDPPPTAGGFDDSASVPASASAPPSQPGCDVVTDMFRAFGRSRGGPGRELVLDRIDRVCWESTGELRADADVSADVEAASASMRWLCAALSDFITASGRAWLGFTAYSTRPPLAGEAFLAGRERGAACYHPGRVAGAGS